MIEVRNRTERARGVGVSSFDAAIMRHLESHLADEAGLLEEYRALAASSDAPVRYIAQLILEDEERHHRVLMEMLNHIRTSAWSQEQAPHVPWLTKPDDPDALRTSIRKLQSHERRDLRGLRKLRRRLGPLRKTSLQGVLVDAMEFDTRKHLRYLRALERLARRG